MGLTLSITLWPGNWGHGVCGPWGCGPAMQVLVACHLTWLVALTPPTVFLLRRSDRTRRRTGLVLIALSLVALLAVIVYQRLVWWPAASEWQQPFFWQRCGFVVVTAVDFPLVQTLLVGTVLSAFSLRRKQAAVQPGATPQGNSIEICR